MLVKKDVEELIAKDEISIYYKYSCLINNIGQELEDELAVEIGNRESQATKNFNLNFFGDRLKITLGPIVKSLNIEDSKEREKYKFKDMDSCYDLRKNGNTFIIKPQEAILVGTNERIKVSEEIGAYIFPRLTNVDAGLIYIPSYIDPCWNGILQAVIYNVSMYEHTLKIGEGISICRFYKLSDSVDDKHREIFTTKSHHYGQAWNTILLEDKEPFPVKKQPCIKQKNWLEKITDFISKEPILIGNILKMICIPTILASIYPLITFFSDLNDLNVLRDGLRDQAKIIEKLETNVINLDNQSPLFGIEKIDIPQNVKSYSQKISLKSKINRNSIIIAQPIQYYQELRTCLKRFKVTEFTP